MIAQHRTSWLWLASGAGVGGALVLLYFFSPTEHAFYPRCLLHSLTGLSCPGCGSLRAIHQLLHGNVAGALRLNPLLLMALPVMVGGALVEWGRFRKGPAGAAPWAWFRHPAWVWSLVTVIVGFGVLRNVPWRRLFHLD